MSGLFCFKLWTVGRLISNVEVVDTCGRMDSQGARADPVVGREESGESAEGSVAPGSAGGVDIGREVVGIDAHIPPGGAPTREFDDKYRPKMYRDKKRIEFLNLVQRDDQTVAKYELHFAALAKYAPKAVVTQGDRCYRFEQGLRPEIKKGLAVRIMNFKSLVESAVRMEEAVIEEKKKGEEKIKLAYTVGGSSRSTKRGTGRSFSVGGGNFSRGSSTFRGNSGPRFSGPVGFNRGSIEGSSFTMPSTGSGRGAVQSYSRGPAFTPSCSTCGRRHLRQCWGPDATPRICYNGGGRGHISRDCPS
ncbi:UNVERIFIED_CONTAM: hypothetical protein Sradi_0194500 [Sesamum radiatum]|uniref:CCHC-type domain-containing protein n=1 Tax=Sesamum radiatum TaxID=300843 RepID=A0AAW2W278_SESRA